jgi:hypothetical protein
VSDPAAVSGPAMTVRLLDFPVPIHARAQEHNDELMREFALIADQSHDDAVDPGHEARALPARLVTIVAALNTNYGSFTQEQDARVAQAVAEGATVIDEMVYELPASAAFAAQTLGTMLDEADVYCQAGQHLLTLATPPELVAYRRWVLGEFVRQAAGQPPMSWPDYQASSMAAPD